MNRLIFTNYGCVKWRNILKRCLNANDSVIDFYYILMHAVNQLSLLVAEVVYSLILNNNLISYLLPVPIEKFDETYENRYVSELEASKFKKQPPYTFLTPIQDKFPKKPEVP